MGAVLPSLLVPEFKDIPPHPRFRKIAQSCKSNHNLVLVPLPPKYKNIPPSSDSRLTLISPPSFCQMGSEFHVLAVDDSVIDRKLIEKLLKASSYQVTVVDSGNKALEYLGLIREQQQDPTCQDQVEVNLVITDYFMPGMTGHDLLRKIKESRSCKDMPVMIMSSEDVPSRISRCLEDGADEFFLKPVRLSDVNKLRPYLLRGRSREKYPGVEEGGRLPPSRIPTLAELKNQNPCS